MFAVFAKRGKTVPPSYGRVAPVVEETKNSERINSYGLLVGLAFGLVFGETIAHLHDGRRHAAPYLEIIESDPRYSDITIIVGMAGQIVEGGTVATPEDFYIIFWPRPGRCH